MQLEHGFTPQMLRDLRAMGYDPVAESAGYARLYLIARRGIVLALRRTDGFRGEQRVALSTMHYVAFVTHRDGAVSVRSLEWTLRIGAMLCFVGHGAFGIMTKQAWLPYFAVAGIGSERAYQLMPLIGALDVTMAMLVLVRPVPIVALWMMAWAAWTALLRPLAGEPIWETLERAGNYGVPAALLVIMAFDRSLVGVFRPAGIRPMTHDTLLLTRRILIGTVALLFVGHGALGVLQKPGLTALYAAAVPIELATTLTPWIGWLEILIGASVIVTQAPRFLLGVALWKLATETLFVAAGAPIWEVVERAGSYAAPTALAIVVLLARRESESLRGIVS